MKTSIDKQDREKERERQRERERESKRESEIDRVRDRERERVGEREKLVEWEIERWLIVSCTQDSVKNSQSSVILINRIRHTKSELEKEGGKERER